MPNVNLNNLNRFWTNAKRYIAKRDADHCDWTSIPVNASSYQFEAEPHTPVNPVVEFGFTETPPAEGEKGPDNPSTITGVDSVTVTKTGKNLCPVTVLYQNYGDITISVNSDGSFTLNGTARSNLSFYCNLYFYHYPADPNGLLLQIGKTYTASVLGDEGVKLNIYRTNANADGGYGNPFVNISSGEVSTFTIGSGITGELIRLLVSSGTTVNNATIKVQIEEGSSATAFEPYSDVSATVSLGETRYGGTIDVATGKLTVTWWGNIFDGTENWYLADGSTSSIPIFGLNNNQDEVFSYPMSASITSSTRFCSHFTFDSSAVINTFITWGTGNRLFIRADATVFSTVYAFKNWLVQQHSNGTPLVFIYKLETPQTIDLNPQQLFSALSNSKVNTVFTDTGTISQLTYAKPAPSQEDVFRYANWHKTETAGAVAFAPVPESELHPVVNFSFTETPPTSGEKGPENPSIISGVSRVVVSKCGANLLKYPYFRNTNGQNSAGTFSWEPREDGTVRFIVNNIGNSGAFYYIDQFLSNTIDTSTYYNLPRGKYRASLKILSGTLPDNAPMLLSHYSGFYGEQATIVNTQANQEEEFTVLDSSMRHLFLVKVYGDYSADIVVRPVLTCLPDADSAIEQYIPPSNYTINLGSTHYGGSIDLSTGLMTVMYWGHAFDGTEPWRENGTIGENYRHWVRLSECNFPNPATGSIYQSCTHCLYNYSFNNALGRFFANSAESGGGVFFNDKNANYPTTEDWKTWVASEYATNHPLTVVYKLATPFTVQLTPQQIKALPALDRCEPHINTLYTNADSIQVEYQKSPIQTEREITNAILALNS